MPIPRLYILHPPEQRLPGITMWMAAAQSRMAESSDWDGCTVTPREYDLQAAFNVPTISDLILQDPGPVVVIEKVQQSLRSRLEAIVASKVVLTCAAVAGEDDLWRILETAREQHEDGLPRIPLREVIAYLILRKLAAQGNWGGQAKNKAFLWVDDLPNGGFPKDICDRRKILDVAHRLCNEGILVMKEGKDKIGLGDKAVVQPILDNRSFASMPALRKFFEKEPTRVSCRILDQKF